MNWLMKGWVVALAVAAGSTAQAGMTFDGKFNSVDPAYGSYNYTARGGTHTSLGGRMNWTGSGSLPTNFDAFRGLNGQTGNNFITFCIEVTANVSYGSTYKVVTDQLKNLPTSGPSAPMNAAKANDIAQFWGRWKSTIATLQTSGTTTVSGFGSVQFDQLGSAIQLAIWEIVYEKAGTGYTVDSEGGSGQGFVVNTGDATTRALANYLLGQTVFDDSNTNLANVIGLKLTNADGTANYQDQVTIIDDDYYVNEFGDPVPVPVPPAVVLVAAGIASGLFLRRRIAGQQAAVVA